MLRRLHATPALPSAFAIFRLIEEQRPLAGALPDSYERLLGLLHRIEAAATGPEHVPVSCHNDLLTANFVRDGARVCIVDWEYAGMNDRYFDLGNLSVNNGFEDEHDRALLELYFDEPVTEARVASLQLFRIVSDFREAMWGAVQLRRSDLDFDYAAYADEHFAAARAGRGRSARGGVAGACRDRVSCPSARASSSSAAGWGERRSPTTSRSSASATSCSSTAPS